MFSELKVENIKWYIRVLLWFKRPLWTRDSGHSYCFKFLFGRCYVVDERLENEQTDAE